MCLWLSGFKGVANYMIALIMTCLMCVVAHSSKAVVLNFSTLASVMLHRTDSLWRSLLSFEPLNRLQFVVF